jgi:hypothetical protein
LIEEERPPLCIRVCFGHRIALALLQAWMPSSKELGQAVRRDVLKPPAQTLSVSRHAAAGDLHWQQGHQRAPSGGRPLSRSFAACIRLIPPKRPSLWSGKDMALPSHPPLRTVCESFPSYGSSLSKPPCWNRLHHLETLDVNLSMAVRMHHDEIGAPIPSAIDPPDDVMDIRPITERHSLFPHSFTRTAHSIPCGLPALEGEDTGLPSLT